MPPAGKGIMETYLWEPPGKAKPRKDGAGWGAQEEEEEGEEGEEQVVEHARRAVGRAASALPAFMTSKAPPKPRRAQQSPLARALAMGPPEQQGGASFGASSSGIAAAAAAAVVAAVGSRISLPDQPPSMERGSRPGWPESTPAPTHPTLDHPGVHMGSISGPQQRQMSLERLPGPGPGSSRGSAGAASPCASTWPGSSGAAAGVAMPDAISAASTQVAEAASLVLRQLAEGGGSMDVGSFLLAGESQSDLPHRKSGSPTPLSFDSPAAGGAAGAAAAAADVLQLPGITFPSLPASSGPFAPPQDGAGTQGVPAAHAHASTAPPSAMAVAEQLIARHGMDRLLGMGLGTGVGDRLPTIHSSAELLVQWGLSQAGRASETGEAQHMTGEHLMELIKAMGSSVGGHSDHSGLSRVSAGAEAPTSGGNH